MYSSNRQSGDLCSIAHTLGTAFTISSTGTAPPDCWVLPPTSNYCFSSGDDEDGDPEHKHDQHHEGEDEEHEDDEDDEDEEDEDAPEE